MKINLAVIALKGNQFPSRRVYGRKRALTGVLSQGGKRVHTVSRTSSSHLARMSGVLATRMQNIFLSKTCTLQKAKMQSLKAGAVPTS